MCVYVDTVGHWNKISGGTRQSPTYIWESDELSNIMKISALISSTYYIYAPGP